MNGAAESSTVPPSTAPEPLENTTSSGHEPLPPPAPDADSTTGDLAGDDDNDNDNENNNNNDNDNDRDGKKRPMKKGQEAISEKKRRRLEKNRLSARECRRRKREATENMEREITMLQGENLRLRLQLQIGDEAEKSMRQEQQKQTEGIDALLKSGASESEIFQMIEEYKEKFADYGRDRRSAIEFHLRSIERLLMPTQTTSVIMATLQESSNNSTIVSGPTTSKDENSWTAKVAATLQSTTDTTENNVVEGGVAAAAAAAAGTGSTAVAATGSTGAAAAAAASASTATDTAATSGNPSASSSIEPTLAQKQNYHNHIHNPQMKNLFTHLVKHLQVTKEQSLALKDSRFVAQEMNECLKASLEVLGELRNRLTQCGQDLESEFDTVRSILTPTQAGKFLVWVANNSACMHMLNELWKRVYPEDDDGGGSIKSSASGTESPE